MIMNQSFNIYTGIVKFYSVTTNLHYLDLVFELNDLHSSPNIGRVIKSKRMRWAGHVARMGGEERRMQGFGGETRGKTQA